MFTGPEQIKEIIRVRTSLPGPQIPNSLRRWFLKSSPSIWGQRMLADNSEVPCWAALQDAALPQRHAGMCLCAPVAYLKQRHAAGRKSDVDPAVIRTVICSVRFEFHLNTNTHVLFLAFRWGAPCQAALQHSLCLWLYGSWSARSFGNYMTYK